MKTISLENRENFVYSPSEKNEVMVQIPLYNHSKSYDENFEDSAHSKFILIEVKKNKLEVVDNSYVNCPLNGTDKIVVNMEELENYGFDRIMVDYDSIFGVRLLNFMQYNPKFFDCQERVFFEALLIKFRKSGFTSFYWSKAKITEELGIKPDKAESIIKKFKSLGILDFEVKKSFNKVERRSQQVTYFSINANKIAEILPEIYMKYEDECEKEDIYLHRDLKKYLAPALSRPLDTLRKEVIDPVSEPSPRTSFSNAMQ